MSFDGTAHDTVTCKCGWCVLVNIAMQFEIRCIQCGRKLRECIDDEAIEDHLKAIDGKIKG